MKGIIFNLLEIYVSDRFGDEFLEEVYAGSGLHEDVPPFVGPVTYSDEELVAMLTLICEKKSKNMNDLLFDFGKRSIPVLSERYPAFFKEYNSSKEFLAKINDIHHIEVHKLYPDAILPVFDIDIINESKMEFTYSSPRKLCNFAKGLINGVGQYYNESITTIERRCMINGDRECAFEISAT